MTLQEIIGLPVLRPAKVLTTPEPGRGRDVASVSVIEVPVDSFIRPGEFVMSTGMNIGQDRKLLACFVYDVAGAGASALALDRPVYAPHPESRHPTGGERGAHIN